MPKKTYKPEEIIGKLREAEVRLSQGASVAEVVRAFLKEAQVLIAYWRNHYNRIRPHSSLGYRPPAPEAWLIPPNPATTSSLMS